MASTGLGDDVAVPHAVIEGLQRPMIALGVAPLGVDFNAPDGQPAHIVFLLLVPPRAHDQEVRILAQIARAMIDGEARAKLLAAQSSNEAVALLSEPRSKGPGRRPPRTSLADI